MSLIKKYLEEDLKSLYERNEVENAKEINNKIIGENYFCKNMMPMYFTGDEQAKTVMVMLNPGAEDKDYNFFKERSNYPHAFQNKSKKSFINFENFISEYIEFHKNYGNIDAKRKDNFDAKQAAFLNYFEDSGVEVPYRFWEGEEKEIGLLKAKQNVLQQKLQLELIPYPSRSFKDMFDSKKKTKGNYKLIKKHVQRMIEIIFQFERKYVLFCSKQFYPILEMMSEDGYNVEIGPIEKKEGITKSVLRMANVRIFHHDKAINGGIIHSFPRMDLPNAYEKMSLYGKFCYEKIKTIYDQ